MMNSEQDSKNIPNLRTKRIILILIAISFPLVGILANKAQPHNWDPLELRLAISAFFLLGLGVSYSKRFRHLTQEFIHVGNYLITIELFYVVYKNGMRPDMVWGITSSLFLIIPFLTTVASRFIFTILVTSMSIYVSRDLVGIPSQIFIVINSMIAVYVLFEVAVRQKYIKSLFAEIERRKKAEEELKLSMQATEQAHALLQERSAKLVAASKLSSLAEVAAGAAHEINNPLAVITTGTHTIELALNKNPPDVEVAKNFCKDIKEASDRIANIIRSLRAFAREGSNDAPEVVSVSTLLETVKNFCKERFQWHQIDFQIRVTDPSPKVSVRTTEITQALLGILNNALDATMESKTEKWIHTEIFQENSNAVIKITNSGPAIPQDIRDKIMQPFFTTKELGRGTGLGLSIAKGIAESHGGKLFLESNAKNTCFVLQLPVSN